MRLPLPAVVTAALAAALLTGCGTAAPAVAPTAGAAFHGVEPAPVRERPDFVLTTTEGRRYDFAQETAGRPTLLYFGYTDCPDECPTAMADVSAALRSVPADLRGQVQVVFVTTDPERDTPERLRDWLDQFDTDYVGLLGTRPSSTPPSAPWPSRRRSAAVPCRRCPAGPTRTSTPRARPPTRHDRPLGYGVAHVNVIFAFDTRTASRSYYPGGVRPSDIAADLPLLVPERRP